MKNKITNHSLMLFAAEILLKIKAFVLIPLLTKNLGNIDYGAWAQVNMINTVLLPIVLLGTDSSILRFLPGKTKLKQQKVFSTWSFFLLISSIISFIVIIASANFWNQLYFNNDENYYNLIIIAAFNIIIIVLFNAIKIYYRLQNKFNKYALMIVSQGVLNFIGVTAALYFYKTLLCVVVFTLISDVLVLLFFGYKIFSIRYFVLKTKYLNILLRYGYVLIPASYAMWILNSIDKIFIVQNFGLAEVGVYSLSYSLGYLIIQLFVNPIYTIFTSISSTLYNSGKLDMLLKLEKYSKSFISLVVGACAAIVIYVGQDIILVVSSKDFVQGWSIVPIIALAYMMHMIASYGIIKLGLINKQYYNSISIMLACVVNIILNFYLVPICGINGAAIALLGAYSCQNLIITLLTPTIFAQKNLDIYFNSLKKFIFACSILYIVNCFCLDNLFFKITLMVLCISIIYLKDILLIKKQIKGVNYEY